VTAESLTPYRKPMGINGDFSIRLQFDSYIRLDSNYLSSLHVLTRATHARSLLPAALASVPFGFCISSSLSSSSSSTASRAWRTGTNRQCRSGRASRTHTRRRLLRRRLILRQRRQEAHVMVNVWIIFNVGSGLELKHMEKGG
jgi:hypothetical protein